MNKIHEVISQKDASTLSTNTNVSIITINNSYQGWYEGASFSHSASNTNYIVGYFGNNYRNYFVFDLSNLNLTGKQITAANLYILDGGCSSGNSTVNYTLYDVISNTNLLIATQSGTTAQGIWNDLGSGVSYGTFSQSTLLTGTRMFTLNQNALNDITSHAGGWFSIGGTLSAVSSDHHLFGCSGNFYQQLVLEVTDNTVPPTGTCPANIIVNNDPNQCGAIVNYSAATFTGDPTPSLNYSHSSGSFFPVGTTTVTVTATNSAGAASCTFTVTVNGGVDTDLDNTPDVCDTDDDGDGVADASDCAPLDPSKWQQASLYIDIDNDNYTNGQQSICYGGTIPIGYKASSLGSDCNDNNSAIH
ncbi:MAG TPA: HYR domain-containing protein, partial [Chitinophagaceae bacterium]